MNALLSLSPGGRWLVSGVLAASIGCAMSAQAANPAYVRVDQLGYVLHQPARVFLMSVADAKNATWQLKDSGGTVKASGTLPGQTSTEAGYKIYPIDVTAPSAGLWTVSISGPVTLTSPSFRVTSPSALFGTAIANGLAYFRNQRDGSGFVPSPLRTAPAHLNDQHGVVYDPPILDNSPGYLRVPLHPTGTTRDVSGGWLDDGGYTKNVESTSFTTAILLTGVRDFPAQLGPGSTADFSVEAQVGITWLLKMWDDSSQILHYQVGLHHVTSTSFGDDDLWRLPQADDTYGGADPNYQYIRNRPVFAAGTSGSSISPNLAGKLSAAFGLCYQVYRLSNKPLANQCLLAGEHVFNLANLAPTGALRTTSPTGRYFDDGWRDDLEWGATELFWAVREGAGSLPPGLPHAGSEFYLDKASAWAHSYIVKGLGPPALNVNDDAGLAHFDLYRAIGAAGSPSGLLVTQAQLLAGLQDTVTAAQNSSGDQGLLFWGVFNDDDTTGVNIGRSIVASEVAWLTGATDASTIATRLRGNMLGANLWGSSFIVGDGRVFPDCLDHQFANLSGALDGTSPVLTGAVVAGPSNFFATQAVPGQNACPVHAGDPYAAFNSGVHYADNVQSYETSTPGLDRASESLLMFGWATAGAVPTLP